MNTCPICGKEFTEGNTRYRHSRHHIYPRFWYPSSNLFAIVCQDCHNEFHRENKMLSRRWSMNECLQRWLNFCFSRGKDPIAIYPHLAKHL